MQSFSLEISIDDSSKLLTKCLLFLFEVIYCDIAHSKKNQSRHLKPS